MSSEKTCFTLKHIRERESAENFFLCIPTYTLCSWTLVMLLYPDFYNEKLTTKNGDPKFRRNIYT